MACGDGRGAMTAVRTDRLLDRSARNLFLNRTDKTRLYQSVKVTDCSRNRHFSDLLDQFATVPQVLVLDHLPLAIESE